MEESEPVVIFETSFELTVGTGKVITVMITDFTYTAPTDHLGVLITNLKRDENCILM